MTHSYTGPKEIGGKVWCASCHSYAPDCEVIIRSDGRRQNRCAACRGRVREQQYKHRPKPRSP